MKAAYTRRGFLQASALIGCSAAAQPWITPIAMAAVPGDNRLVVIILRGAMDGLDIVRPVGDPLWAEYRPVLAKGPMGADLGSGFALHPGLSDLAPLWAGGELGFVHAVSTPYRDARSHFDGQDVLETGMPGVAGGRSDGWLNRLLTLMPGATGETAFAVGKENQLILTGDAPHRSWTPGTRLNISPQARLLLESIYHEDALFRDASVTAIDLADEIDMEQTEGDGMMMGGVRAARQADSLAAFAADRLKGDTRIAAFSISGWDTHRNQGKAILGALSELQAAVLRLRSDLGGVWQKTAVVAMTEFGRTVRENGTSGTDHGTGGVVMLAGGAVRGGKVLGRWPGLASGDLYADRDLMPTGDVRAYAAAALRGQFGISRGDLESVVFPGLDMGAVPDII